MFLTPLCSDDLRDSAENRENISLSVSGERKVDHIGSQLLAKGAFKTTFSASLLDGKTHTKEEIVHQRVEDRVISREIVFRPFKETFYLEERDISSIEASKREIEIQKKFDHPHIVKIHWHHFDKGQKCLNIYAEKCEGGTLQKALLDNRLSEQQKWGILQNIASAMLYIHSQGYTFNDLKPDNILFKKGEGKLTDFGLAAKKGEKIPLLCLRTLPPEYFGLALKRYQLEDEIYEKDGQALPFTREDVNEYEALTGALSGASSTDVYHFGILMWHLFTPNQQESFFDNNNDEFRQKIQDKEWRYADWKENQKIQELIDACLEADPQKRPSMKELNNQLTQSFFCNL